MRKRQDLRLHSGQAAMKAERTKERSFDCVTARPARAGREGTCCHSAPFLRQGRQDDDALVVAARSQASNDRAGLPFVPQGKRDPALRSNLSILRAEQRGAKDRAPEKPEAWVVGYPFVQLSPVRSTCWKLRCYPLRLIWVDAGRRNPASKPRRRKSGGKPPHST